MKTYDVMVIGAGPGGYVAAIRAAQLGMKTAIIEKARMGGMCLNWGCVPSRRMMESARMFDRVRNQSAAFGVEGIDKDAVVFNWKKAITEKDKIVAKLVKGVEYLMKKNGVDIITGEARLKDGTKILVGDDSFSAGHSIIATGTRPDRSSLSHLPKELLCEIDEFYKLPQIPQRIVISGGDTVAVEMASMLRLIGRDVTVVAPEDRLVPWLDGQLASFILDKFKKQGIRVILGASIDRAADGGIVAGEEHVPCDTAINCNNRRAVLPEMEDVPLDYSESAIRVNEFMQTSVPSIYAVGDVTGGWLAHFASAEGICAANHIAGVREPLDYTKIPSVIYMEPEIGTVGQTEEQLKDSGVEYIKGEFPMSVNSKSAVDGTAEGFVKTLADKKYGEILGVHIVSSRATDLIAEGAIALNMEGTLDDLARVIHPHPTVSETFLEAGYKALGRPVNF